MNRIRLPRFSLCAAFSAALLMTAVHPRIALAQLGVGTATSVQVSTLSTGVTLQVSAAVSGDGRYVTMGVDPQFSTFEGLDTIVVPNPNGPGNILQAIGNRSVPFRPAQVGKVTMVEKDKPLLAARAPAMNLKGTSLKTAVRQLADGTKSNIVLGIRGLQEAGVDVNRPQDFAVPAGTTKEVLLGLLQAAIPEQDLVITAEEKVISIATQAQADNTVITKTYYLEDLLANLPRFVSPDTNLNEIGGRRIDQSLDFTSAPGAGSSGYSNLAGYRSGSGGGAAGGQAGAGAKGPTQAKPSARNSGRGQTAAKPSPSTTINDLITSTVRPEIWKVNGGKVGEIATVGNRVTIRAPQSVHALLEGPTHYNPNKVSMYVGYGQ